MHALNTARCQRWNNGHDYWRPAGEPFAPERHEAVLLPEPEVRSFVECHHYAHSYPAARLRVGLLRKEAWTPQRLVGVAVFSVPMNQAVVPHYLDLPPDQGVELGRFVLLDEIEANAETWFLARAFRLLVRALPQVRGVVSYSDPLPRYTAGGETVMPGHVGTIYQAHNAHYLGRGTARTLHMAMDGRVLSPRAIGKLKHGGEGAAGAYRQMLGMGAPPRQPLESDADYVDRALSSGAFRTVRHPGNHVYAWRLDGGISRAMRSARPHPKRNHVDGEISGDAPGLGK